MILALTTFFHRENYYFSNIGKFLFYGNEQRLDDNKNSRDIDDLSAYLDFAQKGYDPDLKLVRMGKRHYSPAIGGFVTPDPLFLENPEKCIESPVECNLYSYAGNNPINNVDPTGNDYNTIESGMWGHKSLFVDMQDNKNNLYRIDLYPTTRAGKLEIIFDTIKQGNGFKGDVIIEKISRTRFNEITKDKDVIHVEQNPIKDRIMYDYAKQLQRIFDNGDMKYQAINLRPNNTKMNCRDFIDKIIDDTGRRINEKSN